MRLERWARERGAGASTFRCVFWGDGGRDGGGGGGDRRAPEAHPRKHRPPTAAAGGGVGWSCLCVAADAVRCRRRRDGRGGGGGGGGAFDGDAVDAVHGGAPAVLARQRVPVIRPHLHTQHIATSPHRCDTTVTDGAQHDRQAAE